MADPIRTGGLMRCCLEKISSLYQHDGGDGSGYEAAEGDRAQCHHCGSSMRFRNEAWEWEKPERKDGST